MWNRYQPRLYKVKPNGYGRSISLNASPLWHDGQISNWPAHQTKNGCSEVFRGCRTGSSLKNQKMATKWSETRLDGSNTGVKSMVSQRTIKILVSVNYRKMNTNLWTSHRKPTLKINVLWAALPNMPCKPRCQFGFLHPSLSACCPGLSLPTDNLSVSLVCVSIGIYLFPHDFFSSIISCFLSLIYIYLASVGIFMDSF